MSEEDVSVPRLLGLKELATRWDFSTQFATDRFRQMPRERSKV